MPALDAEKVRRISRQSIEIQLPRFTHSSSWIRSAE
jgi:hypothetical protein